MAEVFDFGLQEHKIKMDGGFSNKGLFAVVGDTARRLEVQLLNSNNAIQDTTGINLRLNADVAGKLTFVDAVVKDATKGVYTVNLSNGMFLEPGDWSFQWQITKGTSKISSFPFAVKIGENVSEGGEQATNFYLNAEELRLKTIELENKYQAMIEATTDKDFTSAPEIIAARKDKPNLNARLDSFEQSTTAQFQQKDSQLNARLTKNEQETTAMFQKKAYSSEVRRNDKKLELEDFSAKALGDINGLGPVELLSIPQDESVTEAKLSKSLSGFNDYITKTTTQNGKLFKVEEKNGSEVKRKTILNYNLDGTLDTVSEATNLLGVESKLNYVKGNLDSIVNSVFKLQTLILADVHIVNLVTTGSKTDYCGIGLPADAIAGTNAIDGIATIYDVDGTHRKEVIASERDNLKSVGGFYWGASGLSIIFEKGKYATLEEAKLALIGTKINYRLK